MTKLIPFAEADASSEADRDFEKVVMYGKAGIGDKYYFFKKSFKTYYLPISSIKCAYRNIEIVTANSCTAGENLFIQRMYVNTKNGEEIISVIPDSKQAEKLFSLMKDRGILMKSPVRKKM